MKSFKKIGNGKSTGTKLISLDGYFNNPGLYEVDMGSSHEISLLMKLVVALMTTIKAIQVGGPLGGVVPVDILSELLTLDFEVLR